MKLSVIVPVYNEQETIENIIQKVYDTQIENMDKEIIIVNDGSVDKTAEIIKNKIIGKYKNLIYAEHKNNIGKGSSIRTALTYVTGNITIIQDADLEYHPSDYPSLIRPIVLKESKIVYGSRYLHVPPVKSIHWIYKLGGNLITLFFNILYGRKITDEPTCYKAFDTQLLKSLNLECSGFEFCPEVTAKVTRLGYNIKEVPINYSPRSREQGKK